MSRDTQARECRRCRHFRNDAKFLEDALPGLTAMSSAFGSTRADDGICLRHDRYLGAHFSCIDFSPATGQSPMPDAHQPRCAPNP